MTEYEARALFRHVRSLLGEAGAIPVVLVKGNTKPYVTGRSYYWTTLSGKTRIRHPGSYKWPKRYWPSTRCIEVGKQWAHRWLRSHYDLCVLVLLEGRGRKPVFRDARKALRKLRKDPARLEKIQNILGTLELAIN